MKAQEIQSKIQQAREQLLKKKQEPIKIEAAKKDLLFYARWMFEEFYEIEFLESWYHELLCKVLMAVYEGRIKRLIINIPPSYGKTEFAVKLFISWVLGQNSNYRFIYASYSDDLATKTPANTKQMISSEAYKKIFGDKRFNKKADQHWYLDKNGMEDGGMFSTTIAGGVTGFHSDILIIDDPMKAIEKNQRPARKATIDFYTGTAKTRLRKSNPNAAIILIMQRLHEEDLVGYLLDPENGESEYWTHISLTGIEKQEVVYEFENFKYIRPANEPLNIHFEDVEALKEQEKSMKEDWYSQYMQDPTNIETGYIDDDDFCTISQWEIPDENMAIFIDPAQSIKETADNRAIGVIGASLNEKKIPLYTVHDVWFGIWTNKVFCKEIINAMIVYPNIPVYIEDAGGGILTHQNLMEELAIVNQELKELGKPLISSGRINLFTPSKKISKNQKLDYTTTYWKNHQIRFRVGANGVEQVKKECKAFHPDKDSKEDDCFEVVANGVVLDKLKPKSKVIKSNNPIKISNHSDFPRNTRGGWKI